MFLHLLNTSFQCFEIFHNFYLRRMIYLKKTKKIFLIIYCLFLMCLFVMCFNQVKTYALFNSQPELVDRLNGAFESIKGWLITLATPAAAVAVGVGVFMKKFSFGDEERIRVAKKLIRGSLFSYAFILAINLILSAIKSLVE